MLLLVISLFLILGIVGFIFFINSPGYEKVDYIFKDDPSVESQINSYMLEGDLIIEYNSPEETMWIEGIPAERYSINEDKIIIYDYKKENFKLHIGEASDIYEFGNLIGYEFLSNNSVVHIWNTQDDYFFDVDSGIQLTNHYEDYWTKNIFCIGYYNGDEWVKIKCADELTNFQKSIETDDETYVNATLWKDISYTPNEITYNMRLGVNYYLGLNDENLSITIYGKNIGIDIPFDLGFAWKVTDIDVPPETIDKILINSTEYELNGAYDLIFKNMTQKNRHINWNETCAEECDVNCNECIINETEYYTPISSYKLYDRETELFGNENFLRIDWDANLNYAVKLHIEEEQSDSYVTLLINAGHFNPQQEKSTTFYWIDALTDNLVAYYSMDDDAANTDVDDILDNHEGTLQGGETTADISEAGKLGTALHLTGVQGDNIILANEAGLRFNAGTDDFSIFMWINPDASLTHYPLDKRDAGADGYIFILNPDGTLQFALNAIVMSSAAEVDNTWHYVGVVIDRDGNGQMYVDGNASGTAVAINSEVMATTRVPMISGRAFSTNINPYNGVLDDVAFWSRTLSSGEITELWNSGDGLAYPFVELDETPPTFTNNTPKNQTIFYNVALAYDINATDETAFDCFDVNDTTNFKINCSGMLENNTILSIGLYNLNITINDTSNNLNSVFMWVNVTSGNPSVNMAISGTTPIEYNSTSDFSESETNTGDGGCSYSMDRSNIVYGVGTWTFNYSTTGCNNYTAGSVTKDLVVNANASLVLGLTATTPIEYPATTDFTGSGCPTELSCSLNISNEIYQAGDISANYSTAGNDNYSASSTTFTVTIDQNTTYVLSISGTTPIIYGTTTDVAGSDCPAELSCSLDKSNIVYGVGESPVTFNYSTAGNDNYSANSITKDITVNIAGDTFTTLLNGAANNLTVTFPQQVNVSASNNLTTATIDVNGTTFTSGTNYTLGGGVWFVNVSVAGNQNYTSNESHWYITVNQAIPTGSLTGTSPIPYGTIGDVTGT